MRGGAALATMQAQGRGDDDREVERMSRPNAGDPVRAWTEAMRQVASFADQPELVRQLLAPMQSQAELFRAALEQQMQLQGDLARRFFEPLDELVRMLEQAPEQMRTHAEAFAQMSASFRQTADLLQQHAALVEHATAPFRDQVERMRAVSGVPRPDDRR
jgi:methyl-accepting chemotaxis protein